MLGSSSTDYIDCPLDILLSYHSRVTRAASEVRWSEALDWSQRHDEADRRIWIERFRASSG